MHHDSDFIHDDFLITKNGHTRIHINVVLLNSDIYEYMITNDMYVINYNMMVSAL